MTRASTARVYRIEHKDNRIGCFTEDLIRIPGCETKHYISWNHLHSMPSPDEEFCINSFSPKYIFAFPTMKKVHQWARYQYRKYMAECGFVIGVYVVRNVYRRSDNQVMYARKVAEHIEDLPLIGPYTYTSKCH